MKEENNTAKKDNNRTLCPQCKGSLQRNDIKQHILSCRKYIPTYLNNVRRFVDQISPNYAEFLIAEMDLIKEELSAGLGRSNRQSESKSDLKAEEKDSGRKGVKLQTVVKQEKIQQKSLVTKKFKVVKEKIKQNPTAVKNESLPKQQQIKEKISPPTSDKKIGKPIQQTIQLQDLFDYKQVKQLEDQGIPCADPTCTKPVSVNDIQNFTYLDECLHSICKYCFKNYVRNNYVKTGGELTCPNKKCKSLIPIMQIQDILDPDIFSKLEAQLNSKLISALVQCQKCHQHYHFEKGRPSDAPKSTQEGKPLPASMAKHYAENRFQCAKCKSDQCKACKAVPYHMGFNCEEYQEHKLKKKCRYCQKVLPKGYMSETGIKTFDDICDSAECQAQMRDACSKRLPCGHSCYGVIKEKNCLPCLNESCAKPNSSILLGQDETTFCSLCYIEALSEAPCVRSKCGHIFHLKCLNKRISLKWGSPRINFRFCQCPLCNAWIQLPLESEFTKTLQAFKTLQQNIEEKALKRLNHQGLTKDKQIMDPHSEYYNKPIKYAQTIYAYFQCYECHQPYFGGRKNCADAMNEGSQDKKFNPKELICPSCCPVQVNDCKKHGKEFISFKCRFCCTVAQWFCWGNTHFCDNCHRRQISGEYISRIPKDKLAQCEGKEKCPVGGEHGGNGEEFCLGCGVCRGDRIEAAHDF